MKKLIYLILFIPIISFAQKNNTSDALNLCAAMQSNSFSSDADVSDAVDKIFSVIGASQNPILQACSNINNAVAVVYKGQRYILYDREFMNSLSIGTSVYWTNLFILAHEVGHHINGHSLDIVLYASDIIDPKTLEQKREQELEADEFAGFVLGKLGSSLTQIERVLSNLPAITNEKVSTHPLKRKRIQAVREGYKKSIVENDEDKTIVKNDVNKLKNINTVQSQKGRNVPNFLNPRGYEDYQYGNWMSENSWPLEQNIDESEADPFKRKELEYWHAVRRQFSEARGIKIGGEQEPIQAKISILQTTYTDESNFFKKKTHREIQLNIKENIPVVNSYKTQNLEKDYDNEFIRYSSKGSEYTVPKSYIDEFIKLHPEAVYIDKIIISRKYFNYDNIEYFGVYYYIIDDIHSGQFIVKMEGYDSWYYGHKSWEKNHKCQFVYNQFCPQDNENAFGVMGYGHQSGENPPDGGLESIDTHLSAYLSDQQTIKFIDMLKKGKKLYLRFDKLIVWNGYLKDGKINTSQENKDFYIKPHTYVFDLTGSSKALRF